VSATGSPFPGKPRKQISRTVFQWPEWKAFAARLGVSNRPLTKVVVTLEYGAVALVEETFIGIDSCPTPPSGTAPTESSMAKQKPDHLPPSEDMTATGHD
jgi:hypothetical protein